MEQINKNTLVSVHDDEITLLEAFEKFKEVLNLSEEVNSVKDKELALEQFVTDAYGRLNNKILTNANEIERVDEKTRSLDNDIMDVKQLIKPVYAYTMTIQFNTKIALNDDQQLAILSCFFYSSEDKELGDITMTEAIDFVKITRLARAYVGVANVTLMSLNDATNRVQFVYFDTAQNKHVQISKTDVTRIRITGKKAV